MRFVKRGSSFRLIACSHSMYLARVSYLQFLANQPKSEESPMNESPKAPLQRRTFLTAAGAAAAVATQLSAKSYARVIGANDRLGVGLIGGGVIGKAHMGVINNLKEKNNLHPVCVADCWKTRAQEGKATIGADHAETDYRKLLEHKDIDYVVVATPEHWHWTMTIDAMEAGKAVGKAIQEGMIGKVLQAQIEYVRRYNKDAGPWREPALVSQHKDKPVDLDWNAWLGSAPKIDWNPNHYFEWRCYSAYSGGICTDLFIHRITRIMKACNLLYPRRVVGMGGIWQWPDGRDLPDNIEMICEYPRGMTVYVLGTMGNRVRVDHVIRGYEGTLFFNNEGWVAKDPDGKVLGQHKKTGGEDQNLHHTNLHNHLRNGEPLNCPIELGLAGVVAVNMANESWRTNRMMGWDRVNEKMVPADLLKDSHEPEA